MPSDKKKKFVIVGFTDEDCTEVIPSIWMVNESLAKWPNVASTNLLSRFIRECRMPGDDWETVNIKIYAYAKTFASAQEKVKMSQETSNLGSDSSVTDSEVTNRRKRTAVRSIQQLLSENSESELEEALMAGPKKKFKLPIMPCITGTTPASGASYPSPVSKILVSQLLKQSEKTNFHLKQLNTKCDKLQLEVAGLKAMLGKDSRMPCFEKLPLGITFPITTNDNLMELEKKLERTEDLQSILARYLCAVSMGKTPQIFLLSMTRHLLERDVATQYSRMGKRGKRCFADLKMYNVILAAASLKFPDCEKEEFAEKFGKVLASSSDWDGHRHKETTPLQRSMDFTST